LPPARPVSQALLSDRSLVEAKHLARLKTGHLQVVIKAADAIV
jgi:hypothetical protein